MSPKRKIVIVGAGISGLSCAWALLCADVAFDVTIVADHFTPATTSDVAGGLWFPYATSHPKIFAWCETTRAFYHKLDSKSWGISYPEFIWYESGEEARIERESWAHLFPDLQQIIDPVRLPKNAIREFRTSAPLIETPKFMAQFMKLLKERGVHFRQTNVLSLESLIAQYKPDAVVNCCGIRAADLVGDQDVFPIRGILLNVQPTSEGRRKLQNRCFCYDDNPDGMSYVFPRDDAVWVGGVAEKGNTNPEVTNAEVTKILDRAVDMCPELTGCSIREVRVAARPGRSTIRLEPELVFGHLVVHNYGHGGSGWTVMWGCALDVANIVQNAPLSPKL